MGSPGSQRVDTLPVKMFLVKYISVLNHPLYSPDPAPCHMSTKSLKGTRFRSVVNVKGNSDNTVAKSIML